MDQSPEGLALLGMDEEKSLQGSMTGMTEAPATFEEALAAIANDSDNAEKPKPDLKKLDHQSIDEIINELPDDSSVAEENAEEDSEEKPVEEE